MSADTITNNYLTDVADTDKIIDNRSHHFYAHLSVS